MKGSIFFRPLWVITFLLFSIFFVQAQDGIYKTYDDYLNKRLILIDSNSLNALRGSNALLRYKINGVLEFHKQEDIFGVMYKGEFCRIAFGLNFKIEREGEYYLWHHYSVVETPNANGSPQSQTYDITCISKGIDGKIFHARTFATLKALANKQPEFAPFFNCVNEQINKLSRAWQRVYHRPDCDIDKFFETCASSK